MLMPGLRAGHANPAPASLPEDSTDASHCPDSNAHPARRRRRAATVGRGPCRCRGLAAGGGRGLQMRRPGPCPHLPGRALPGRQGVAQLPDRPARDHRVAGAAGHRGEVRRADRGPARTAGKGTAAGERQGCRFQARRRQRQRAAVPAPRDDRRRGDRASRHARSHQPRRQAGDDALDLPAGRRRQRDDHRRDLRQRRGRRRRPQARQVHSLRTAARHGRPCGR